MPAKLFEYIQKYVRKMSDFRITLIELRMRSFSGILQCIRMQARDVSEQHIRMKYDEKL